MAANFCRIAKRNGGSCIFVKNHLNIKEVKNFETLNLEQHFEASIIEIAYLKIIIICVYRSPDSDINIFVERLDHILNYYKTTKTVIIIGDMNVDFSQGNLGEAMTELMILHNLNKMITQPTRVTTHSQKIIDQYLINNSFVDFKVNVFETGFSDHFAQLVSLSNLSSKLTKKSKGFYR